MRSKDLRQSECGSWQSSASIFDASCNWIFIPKCVRRNTAWKCLGQQGQNIVAHCHVWVDCEQRILLRSLREGQRYVTSGMLEADPGSGVWGRVVIRGNNRVMIRDLHTLRHTDTSHCTIGNQADTTRMFLKGFL